MNHEQPSPRAVRRMPGENEMENEHERRQRIRSDRMRKWRKETRHPRTNDFDDGTQMTLPRRFAS